MNRKLGASDDIHYSRARSATQRGRDAVATARALAGKSDCAGAVRNLTHAAMYYGQAEAHARSASDHGYTYEEPRKAAAHLKDLGDDIGITRGLVIMSCKVKRRSR